MLSIRCEASAIEPRDRRRRAGPVGCVRCAAGPNAGPSGRQRRQFPTARDLKSLTTAGSYLAARHASVERDAASAAAFYRSALRTDPKNNELLDRAFISSLAEGNIDEAVKLADRVLAIDKIEPRRAARRRRPRSQA